MQVGSRMIKAVAGGLHFETINRPPGAESNSKLSISVSPGSQWHRGIGHAEGCCLWQNPQLTGDQTKTSDSH
ncbi:hypothetical protein PAMP_005156 [Pampus punctatissimus]